MSKKRGDKDYLADMQEALGKIQRYVEGYTLDRFTQDSRTQDAVIRITSASITKSSGRLPRSKCQKLSPTFRGFEKINRVFLPAGLRRASFYRIPEIARGNAGGP
jgi:hypothetical protein